MTVSAEQTSIADELSNYADDPIGFAIDVLNLKLDAWQCRFLEAVREYPRVAVRSSTGQGKDFIAAAADLWFAASFEKAYCPCSANSEDQLRNILWKQFAELIDNSNGLEVVFQWTATTIRHRKYPAEWFIFAKTSAKRITGQEQHAEGSSGHHSKNMLILLDEASGIDEVFWQAYEPTLTGPNNKIVAIGNPNRLSGSFHSIWYKSQVAGFWRRFTVAGRDNSKARASIAAGDEFCVSPRGNQSGNHDYLISKWGVNHPIVQSKVFGVHPTSAIERAAYAYEEIRAAQSRKLEPSKFDPVQIGIDVSGGGRDRTVYMIRRGSRFRMVVERPQSIHHIVDKALELADEEPDPTAEKYDYQPLIVPDAGALADLSGWLKKAGYRNVRGVHFGGSPRNRKLYGNLAAEMWLEDLKGYFDCIHCGRTFEAHYDEPNEVRDPVECDGYVPGCQLPGDDAGEEADELMTQLITRQWFYTGKTRDQRVLKSKDELRKETGKSPDHADALCLAVVRPMTVHAF